VSDETTAAAADNTPDKKVRRKKLGEALGLFESADDSELGITSNVSLRDAAQKRYLNYALSVITSRALPDVRDGLKPVQRRILFTMWQADLKHPAKHRKCAKVVGDVMGNYHPHGDSSIYEALVRMAQPFSLRMPLVNGQGNFGSLDGDNAAAMRYTECRLDEPATPMLEDIGRSTVPWRDNYDGTRQEPVVLPAKLPNLLINGAMGIAVGMATSIPPHNPGEVLRALLKVLDNSEIKDFQLVADDAIKGPDFPTGGEMLTTREELREMYKTGSGSVKVRGTWHEAESKARGSKTLIIDSIPYGVNKAELVTEIADIVVGRKMPLLTNVDDFSGEDIRIELELKKEADENLVMAYLCKNTKLQQNFSVNMTCLIPTNNPQVCQPQRLGLLEILKHFLLFRHEVITKRLENELDILKRRLHILDGFAIVFDALDEIIALIRKSDGKADAAAKMMKRFVQLDDEQTEAILELKLYRLAKLEINLILEEIKEKKKRVNEINKLLADDDSDYTSGRWGIVRAEIEALIEKYGGKSKTDLVGKRRTKVGGHIEQVEFKAEDFIVAEDAHILVTADGWVKRQKEIKDPMAARLREGDSVLACFAGSTTACALFFSSRGVCYTARIVDLPATTGFGEPIQKFFKLADGEKIIAAYTADPRVLKNIKPAKEGAEPKTQLLAATSDGYALRLSLEAFAEPSTKAGRKFARPGEGVSVVGAFIVDGSEILLAVSERCHAMVCKCSEVSFLNSAGKGVMLMKVEAKDDRLIGLKPSRSPRDLMRIETNRGAEKTISTEKYRTVGRGGKGVEIQSNGKIAKIMPEAVAAPEELK